MNIIVDSVELGRVAHQLALDHGRTACLYAKRLGFICLVLAGCAQTPTLDPNGPNTAKLRLRMEEPINYNLFLSFVDAKACKPMMPQMILSGGVERVYKENRIGMYGESPAKEGILEYVVAADKPLSTMPISIVTKESFGKALLIATTPLAQEDYRKKTAGDCATPAFMPVAGGQYEMTYRIAPGSCDIHVYSLTMSEDAVVRTDMTDDLKVRVTKDSHGKLACGS